MFFCLCSAAHAESGAITAFRFIPNSLAVAFFSGSFLRDASSPSPYMFPGLLTTDSRAQHVQNRRLYSCTSNYWN